MPVRHLFRAAPLVLFILAGAAARSEAQAGGPVPLDTLPPPRPVMPAVPPGPVVGLPPQGFGPSPILVELAALSNLPSTEPPGPTPGLWGPGYKHPWPKSCQEWCMECRDGLTWVCEQFAWTPGQVTPAGKAPIWDLSWWRPTWRREPAVTHGSVTWGSTAPAPPPAASPVRSYPGARLPDWP
jgi:hypothetical protein